MTTSSLARAEAVFQEQIHAQWRDWRTYLRARLTLLDVETSSHQAAFERDEAREVEATEARRALAALPPALRGLFDDVREARRQQLLATLESSEGSARAQLRDLDEIDRQALSVLLAEAEGTADGGERTPDWGDVPLRLDGAIQWYRVHVPTLLGAPGAAAYAAATSASDDLRRRLIVAALLSVGALLFLAVWFLWPRSTPPSRQAVTQPTGNGTSVSIWPIRVVRLTSSDGTFSTLSVSSTVQLGWPDASDTEGTPIAFWRENILVPLHLCLPPARLASLTGVTLISGGELPDRAYRLSTTRGNTADLVIAPCDAGDAARALYGTLESASLPAALAVGDSVTVGERITITVSDLALVGPGEDPGLPANTARVIVRLRAPPLDWPSYAPTLLLDTGQSLTSPEQTATSDGVELRYLVPLPGGELQAVWSITPPESLESYRWRTTFPPPPSRTEVLRASLTARDLQIDARPGAGYELSLTLVNEGALPLLIQSSDLLLTQGTSQLAAPDLAELRQPLEPGATRRVTIPLDLSDTSEPLIVTVGAQRFQISW
jgi:hypothetical protein